MLEVFTYFQGCERLLGGMMGVTYRGERMIGNMPFSLILWAPWKRGKKKKIKSFVVVFW
jgi:hypothetical protein